MTQPTNIFRIDFTATAEKQFKKFDRSVQLRLRPAIDALAKNPFTSGAKKMQASGEALWRIRVGDYRIVYRIEGHRLVVLILKVGHRREVYR